MAEFLLWFLLFSYSMMVWTSHIGVTWELVKNAKSLEMEEDE